MRFATKKPQDPIKLESIYNANREDLKRFYGNVEYLCNLRYGSRDAGLLALYREVGWITTSKTVLKTLTGDYYTSSFTVLRAWALLFDEPVGKLLWVDYRAEAELKKG